MERIESLPRTRELRAEPEMASLEELRRRLGPRLSDEEFLLRATMPLGQVDAMVAAGPARRHYNPSLSPVLDLIRKLAARSDLDYVAIDKAGMRLELRRHTAAGTAASTADNRAKAVR
jgi:oxaloacetate decarboxylase alpha subunit